MPVIKLLYFSSKLTFYFLLSEVGAGAPQPILLHYLLILDKALLLIRTVGLDKGDRSCFFLFPGFPQRSHVTSVSSLTAATASPSQSQTYFAVFPTFSNQLHCSPLLFGLLSFSRMGSPLYILIILISSRCSLPLFP